VSEQCSFGPVAVSVAHVRCGSCARPDDRFPSTRTARHRIDLGAIADPALACEVTMQPVRRYGVDAAILSATSSCRITPLASASTWCRDAVP